MAIVLVVSKGALISAPKTKEAHTCQIERRCRNNMATKAKRNLYGGPTLEHDLCGIVMPISSLGDYDENHWKQVKSILEEAIVSAGMTPNLVSDADDIGVIQARIVNNIYNNKIIICDVSGKNPNVMFELGLRLAFDKPVIIVKDDVTGYSFDTSPIEHLVYRRDLQYQTIIDFKESLRLKIIKSLERYKDDVNYSPFLKHFGEFKIGKIETKEVTKDQFIIKEISAIRNQIESISLHRNAATSYNNNHDWYASDVLWATFYEALDLQLETAADKDFVDYSEVFKIFVQKHKSEKSRLESEEVITHYTKEALDEYRILNP
jgi:hypothetical protein